MTKEKRKPRGYWDNKELCQKLASLCSSRTEFLNKYPAAYRKSLKRGWHDEICKHMIITPSLPAGTWTKEKCRLEAQKYTTRTEFSKHNSTAYSLAVKKGWLNEICQHMVSIRKLPSGKRPPNGYWNNKQNCAEVAALCSSRTEFQQKYATAYGRSLKNGWIDEICEHMKGRPIPCGYWTKEKCRLEALRYTNRTDFSKQSNGAYTAALKKGWLDEICKHMVVKWQFKWDKESCRAEALKYTNRSDFHKYAVGAWTAACEKGWLDEICKHMIVKWHPKWDKESCHQEALKYTNRKEFQKHASGAWAAASKNDWLDEICSHMEVLGNLFKRCIYSFEFSDNYVYVGLTDNFRRREIEHLSKSDSAVFQHIQKTNLKPTAKILHEYTDKVAAQKLERSFLEDYISKGWNALNKIKTGSLGGRTLYWTKERCIEAGKKCKTKGEFIKKYYGAYSSAVKHGWYDEISAHMVLPDKQLKWTKERCIEAGKKCKTKGEFEKTYSGAYASAKRYGWYDEVTAHMISPIAKSQEWTLEKVQAESLKYDTRKEFAICSFSAYNFARRNKILNLVCQHMVNPNLAKKNKSSSKWTMEVLQAEALKYTSRNEFASNNPAAYSAAKVAKLLDKICAHMEYKHKCDNYWTKEKCQERALLYTTKSDFKKNDGSAYTTAVREKWLNDICTHMTRPPIKRKWTYEKLYAEAQKYRTVKEFKQKSHSAYVTAVSSGVVKQICFHMYTGKRKANLILEDTVHNF